jgi:hypothetical protein
MLSARTIYEEIFDNDEAFGLFCSIAASGEAQGGWENGKIAALVPGSQAGLAAKIARHGADEDKHGRIFTALLRKRGLEPVPVPADTDYTMRLEAAGVGLAHARLRREELLRLAAVGHGEVIRATLRATALAEIAIYRDVSLAVMAHLGRILGWPRPKAAVLAAGIRGVYAYERPGGWRRMVSLRMPARRNALSGPVPAQASHA